MDAKSDSKLIHLRMDLVFAGLLASMVGVACDSGLEGLNGLTAASQGRQSVPSSNLRTTIDTCLTMSGAMGEMDIAGGVVPGNSNSPERPIAFVAFSTEVAADDADGDISTNDPLDADGTPDSNQSSDIFIAAIDSSEIDPRDFVYSIQNTMRHPRCVTCHSMNAADSVAFASAPGGHISNQPPLGDVQAEQCMQCHEVSDWRSPPATFDLRANASVALFARAKAPIDVTAENPSGAQHFKDDPRVRWALESGVLPFGNVADDDHDGIAEPSDTDGIVRTVPGGGEAFDRRLDAWLDTGRGPLNGPVNKDDLRFDSAADALQEIVLVSRNESGDAAANAIATEPSLVFVSNAGYVPGGNSPLGTLLLAYTSEPLDTTKGEIGANLVGGGVSSSSDVYRVSINVFVREDGSIDLDYLPSLRQLVSENAEGEGGGGNAGSRAADIGDWGNLVAFESEATNLAQGVSDNNGARDVFVRDLVSGVTHLVSHVSGDPLLAGNGASGNPDFSPFGSAVAFESDSSDLVPSDTNGSRDVFFASASAGFLPVRASVRSDGSQANGGDSRNPSIASLPGSSDFRIAFESEKINLVERLPSSWTTNVYLRNTANGGRTLLLNKIQGPDGERLPTAAGTDGGTRPVIALNPAFSPDGQFVLFESNAQNLDFVRPFDENGDLDVFLADLQLIEVQGAEFLLPYAISVNADGGRSDGRSFAPRVGAFDPPALDFPLGLALFDSTASNLGNMDPGDLNQDGLITDGESNSIVTFLREGAAVVAHFEADKVRVAANSAIQFVDQSSGRPSEFLWDFGDAGTSEEQNPLHVYNQAGAYNVELTVTSGQLGSDTKRREAFIRVLGPVKASFGANPTIGAIAMGGKLSINFEDMSAELPEVWSWKRRRIDTTIPEVLTEFSTEQNPTADFERGIYEVLLEAEGLGGRGLSKLTTIEVYNSVTSAIQTNLDRPEGVSTAKNPLVVEFTDKSTGDVDGIEWSFGPGAIPETSMEAKPTVAFPPGPPYNVTLKTRGKGGDFAMDDVTVRAIGNLSANFLGLPQESILGLGESLEVDFNNMTAVSGQESDALFYRWENGGTTFSTAFDPPNQSFGLGNADVPSNFSVRLVASLSSPVPATCASEACSERTRTLTVYPELQKPQLAFVVTPNQASNKAPHKISFSSSVIGDGNGTDAKYEWLRSGRNGSVATIPFANTPNPTFDFTEGPGKYAVRLKVNTKGIGSVRQEASSDLIQVQVKGATFTQFYNLANVAVTCVECHESDPANGLVPSGDLNLKLSGNEVPSDLVERELLEASHNTGITTCFAQRVEPGDPVNSVLYDIFLDPAGGERIFTCAETMRSNLPPGVNADDAVELLRSWILDGAKSN